MLFSSLRRAALAVFLGIVFFAQAASAEDVPYFGLHLDALDLEMDRTKDHQLKVPMAGAGDFTVNVNIQRQEYDGTMEDYVKLSKGQFKEMFTKGYKMPLDKQSGEDEFRGEIIGNYLEKDMHFYFRAIKKGSKVYLFTAVALVSQWPKVGSRLKAYVESMKAD